MSTPLPETVTNNFTCPCHVCGATVHVVDGTEQPHRCRIEIPARTEENTRHDQP